MRAQGGGAHAQQLAEDGGGLERVGDDTPLAERERGGRDAIDLSDQHWGRERPLAVQLGQFAQRSLVLRRSLGGRHGLVSVLSVRGGRCRVPRSLLVSRRGDIGATTQIQARAVAGSTYDGHRVIQVDFPAASMGELA